MESRRHNYKNLKIWAFGLEIACNVSDLLKTFPRHERFDLTSQINRCAISIPSNISEGSARSNKSFRVFIDYSLGSSFELGTQLLIAKHKDYIDKEQLKKFESQISEWQRMTMSFQNSLRICLEITCPFLWVLLPSNCACLCR